RARCKETSESIPESRPEKTSLPPCQESRSERRDFAPTQESFLVPGFLSGNQIVRAPAPSETEPPAPAGILVLPRCKKEIASRDAEPDIRPASIPRPSRPESPDRTHPKCARVFSLRTGPPQTSAQS